MLIIKELREEANLTQKQLANAINNMQRNVCNWEKGVSEPDLQTVVAIADYFHVSLDELFGRDPHAFEDNSDYLLLRTVHSLNGEQKKALQLLLESFQKQ